LRISQSVIQLRYAFIVRRSIHTRQNSVSLKLKHALQTTTPIHNRKLQFISSSHSSVNWPLYWITMAMAYYEGSKQNRL